MTSADDFVLQLLQDKGLVDAEAVASARHQVKPETPADQVDASTIEVLIESHNIRQEQIYQALAAEIPSERDRKAFLASVG